MEIGNSNSQQQAGASEGKAKGFSYRCAVSCTYNGKFYREGDIIVLPEKKEVPHFELADEKK